MMGKNPALMDSSIAGLAVVLAAAGWLWVLVLEAAISAIIQN